MTEHEKPDAVDEFIRKRNERAAARPDPLRLARRGPPQGTVAPPADCAQPEQK